MALAVVIITNKQKTPTSSGNLDYYIENVGEVGKSRLFEILINV